MASFAGSMLASSSLRTAAASLWTVSHRLFPESVSTTRLMRRSFWQGWRTTNPAFASRSTMATMVAPSTPRRSASSDWDRGKGALDATAMAIQLAWLTPRRFKRRSITWRQLRAVPWRTSAKRSSISAMASILMVSYLIIYHDSVRQGIFAERNLTPIRLFICLHEERIARIDVVAADEEIRGSGAAAPFGPRRPTARVERSRDLRHHRFQTRIPDDGRCRPSDRRCAERHDSLERAGALGGEGTALGRPHHLLRHPRRAAHAVPAVVELQPSPGHPCGSRHDAVG